MKEELLWLKLGWKPGGSLTHPLSEQLLGELSGL